MDCDSVNSTTGFCDSSEILFFGPQIYIYIYNTVVTDSQFSSVYTTIPLGSTYSGFSCYLTAAIYSEEERERGIAKIDYKEKGWTITIKTGFLIQSSLPFSIKQHAKPH